MRLRVALVGILLAMAGPAAADKVKTNQDAKLYSRAGEQGQVIMKVKEGQSMTILATDGRWLKVRVSGRTGYIPRSKVNLPEGEDDLVRNTRRRPFVDGRGTRRGFGSGAPDDRVGGDAVGNGGGDKDTDTDTDTDPDEKPTRKKPPKETPKDKDGDDDDVVVKDDERPTAKVLVKTSVYSEADDESEEQFSAKKGELLFPTGKKKGKFVEVENDEGDIGFVLGSKVSMVESSGGGGGKGGRTMEARARLGFTYITQALRSAGGVTTQPDNYDLGTPAVAFALGGTVLYPYKPKYKLGADVSYEFAKAVPGIKVMGGTTGITLHNFTMRAVGAYDLNKSNGMMLVGRLGIHYQSFQVSDVEDLAKNTAKLPSENITSPTLGVGIVIPKFKPKIGLRFTLDTMIGASVTQTKNLEDGVNPGAKGVSVNAGLTYKWKPDMDIVAAYDLDYMVVNFGEPVMNSQRGHTGTAVKRADMFNALTIGFGKAF